LGSAKRAVRYLIRKKSKTVILFLVLLISEAMILSTASNEAKSELQKKTKTKILAGIMENNNPITTEDINKIQKLKGIDKINKNATLSAYPTNFQTVTENQNTNTENLQVRLVLVFSI
jgi:putative ABC transport system permease protein